MNNIDKLNFIYNLSKEYDERTLTGSEIDTLREILSDTPFWQQILENYMKG